MHPDAPAEVGEILGLRLASAENYSGVWLLALEGGALVRLGTEAELREPSRVNATIRSVGGVTIDRAQAGRLLRVLKRIDKQKEAK